MAHPASFAITIERLLCKACVIGCLMLLNLPAVAATFTVTTHSDAGIGSFRQAVLDANAAPGADTIVFGSVTGNINIGTPITISDDLTIKGPGVNSLTLNSLVTANFDLLFLAPDGSGSRNLVISDLTLQQGPVSTKRLLRGDSQGSITVRNVKLLGNGNKIANSSGGAIAAIDTDVLIQNSNIDNFNTDFRGGAVFMQADNSNETADLEVEDSTFSNNVTSGSSSTFTSHGGAIAAEITNGGSATVTIRNSSFTGNATLTSGSGGAIAAEDSVSVEDSSFSKNTAIGDGGAIYGVADISIDHGYLSENMANGSGGAIYLNASLATATLAVRNSVLTTNAAVDSGGVAYVFNDNVQIENTTFDNNTASRGGVLEHQITGMINVVNSTFSGNSTTKSGGAIYSDATAPGSIRINMLNTTMVNNSASDGGGIRHEGQTFITLVNSIVADNHATSATGQQEIRGAATIDFSQVGNDPGDADQANITELTPGNSIYDMDPMLGVLADNGGQRTGRNGAMPITTHAVLDGSILIGAGDSSATNSSIALPANDQRGAGFPRIKDGAIEIGAVEFDTPVAVASGGGGGSLSWWLIGLVVLVARRKPT